MAHFLILLTILWKSWVEMLSKLMKTLLKYAEHRGTVLPGCDCFKHQVWSEEFLNLYVV